VLAGNEFKLPYEDYVAQFFLRTGGDRRATGTNESVRCVRECVSRAFIFKMWNDEYRQAMNPFRTGKLVMFQVTYDREWHFFEIVFFVILGTFGVSVRFLVSAVPIRCCGIMPIVTLVVLRAYTALS
jgi:hypothetical protein